MFSIIRATVVILVIFTIITGVAYPLAVWGFASSVFPHRAGGSIIVDAQGRAIGSSLIGQPFDDAKYFWPRLSATSPVPYTAFNGEKGTCGTGSNLGPTNPALLDAVKQRLTALKSVDPDNKKPVPVDLVTASASGLDPHISPAAAEYQAPRVARVRGLSENIVRELIARCTESRKFGILGEARVNVLQLNLSLDGLANHVAQGK